MSKPKDDWWICAVWAIRNYPARKEEYEEMHRAAITAQTSGMPGGSDVSRTTENLALRQLAPAKQREYEAVQRAIGITKLLPDGDIRLELIRRVYWQGRKINIDDAVYSLNISAPTGWRWHKRFVRQVGECLGYIL